MEILFLVFCGGTRETYFPLTRTRTQIPMSELELADEDSNAKELYILNELFI